ncbi:MAG: O-antigen ligase family protein [Bryobacteraceae bacterium]
MPKSSGDLRYRGTAPRVALEARAPAAHNRWKTVCFVFLWLLVFTVPWGDMIQLPYDIQFSRILTIPVALAWLLSIWHENSFRPPLTVHIAMLAFILWAAMNVFWTADPERSARRILSYSQLFLDAWLVYQFARTGIQYRKLLQAVVLGGYVAFAGLLYGYMYGHVSGDGRFSAPGFDANDLAATLALIVPLAWYLAMTGKKYVWLNRLYVPCAIAGALLTASRSGLAVAGVTALFPLLAMGKLSRRKKIGIFFLAAVTAGGVFEFGNEMSFNSRLSTFADQLSRRDLNGRVDIWEHGWTEFLDNPLVGVGAGAFSSSVGGRGAELVAHNTYLEILVEHGAIGLLAFLAVVFGLFRGLKAARHLEWRMWATVLAAWLVTSSVLSWENREMTWLLWGLCTAERLQAAHSARKERVRYARAA